jgi:hypothetical protein
VLQRFVLHDRQDGGNAQTVVGAQRSAFSLHPLAVNPRLYRVCLEVMGRFRCFLRHHVHVSLQDDTLTVLHACRGGLAHDDVACGVLEGLYTGLLAEVEQELLYFLQMSAGAWYLCECIEVFPDALRIQVQNFVHSFLFFV